MARTKQTPRNPAYSIPPRRQVAAARPKKRKERDAEEQNPVTLIDASGAPKPVAPGRRAKEQSGLVPSGDDLRNNIALESSDEDKSESSNNDNDEEDKSESSDDDNDEEDKSESSDTDKSESSDADNDDDSYAE